MAPAADGDIARPARMPRLTYRNHLPADQLSLSSTHTSSSNTPSNETAAGQRLSTPNSTAPSSPARPNSDSGNRDLSDLSKTSGRSKTATLASNASASKDPKAPKKKKNGVLGFLALKEPSHSALEEFAEQQRKLASEKGSIGNTIALGTVSPQKLPASVPKVNSKWDGVPEAQRKAKDKESLRSKSRSTAPSTATSRFSVMPSASSATNDSLLSISSDGSSRNPPNSIVSTANSSTYKLSDRSRSQSTLGPDRDSGPSASTPDKSHSSMSSPSMTSLPEISYFFPDNPNASGSLPSSSKESTAKGKQPISLAPAVQKPTASRSFLDLETDRPANSSNLSSATSRPEPSAFLNLDGAEEFSVSVPVAQPVVGKSLELEDLVDTEAIFRVLSKPQGFRAGEAQEMKLPDSHSFLVEDPGGAPANGRILFDEDDSDSDSEDSFTLLAADGDAQHNSSMNFSRPLSVQSSPMAPDPASLSRITIPHRRGPSGLPTLYEVSIASSQDITAGAIEPDTPRKSIDAISIAPSIASSVTPSVMSESWYQSPRERLGLGGPRIRKHDVIPWDNDGKLPGKPKRGGRLSLFSKG